MKKLIRDKIVDRLKPEEWECTFDIPELNKLYALKVKEELNEIILADFNDGLEFADLIEVAYAFAKVNGFSAEDVDNLRKQKNLLRGGFSNTILTNLNPDNPSNQIYVNEL